MPDWWEQQHFGSPVIALAGQDLDGDGLTNLDEYDLYGSDPLAASIGETVTYCLNVANTGDLGLEIQSIDFRR